MSEERERPTMRWADRLEAGSCNTCHEPHHRVLVIVGVGQMEVRLCRKCVEQVAAQRNKR